MSVTIDFSYARIGWSEFARLKESSLGDAILNDVICNWDKRVPGKGRDDCTKVVKITLSPDFIQYFPGRWIPIENATDIIGKVIRRQPAEDPFVRLYGHGDALPTKHVDVILYSHDTLKENDGTASDVLDWEIVAVIASPFDDEPMDPTTMSRNYLEMVGGTFAPYTTKEFAESIYFWRGYVAKRHNEIPEEN
jgi:hypothetical protein